MWIPSQIFASLELQGVAAMIVESDSKDCVDALAPSEKEFPGELEVFAVKFSTWFHLFLAVMLPGSLGEQIKQLTL